MPAPGATGLIDSVDGRDHAIGEVRRGDALVVGANFRTAHVFLFNPDGQLLLQRLASARERHPQRWGSSVAAYLHAGETYAHAAQRRLREELGLAVPIRYVAKTSMPDERSTKFVTLYTGTTSHAEIRDHQHIDELLFWDRAELEVALRTDQASFTPTFAHLYELFRNSRPPA